jgi:hypothetical protein
LALYTYLSHIESADRPDCVITRESLIVVPPTFEEAIIVYTRALNSRGAKVRSNHVAPFTQFLIPRDLSRILSSFLIDTGQADHESGQMNFPLAQLQGAPQLRLDDPAQRMTSRSALHIVTLTINTQRMCSLIACSCLGIQPLSCVARSVLRPSI